MALKTVAECIERILGTLSQEERDQFVHKLAERQQEPRVLLSTVEKKRHWEVATVMVNTFLDQGAVEVAVEILSKMSLDKKAQQLGMPPRSVRDCINQILGSLSEDDFHRFVHELVKREQEPRVLLERVEKKRRWEVTDVMVNTFTDNVAVKVAKELLEQMNLIKPAEELGELVQRCGNGPTPSHKKVALVYPKMDLR